MSEYSQEKKDDEDRESDDLKDFDEVLIESMLDKASIKPKNPVNSKFDWLNEYLDPSEPF